MYYSVTFFNADIYQLEKNIHIKIKQEMLSNDVYDMIQYSKTN